MYVLTSELDYLIFHRLLFAAISGRRSNKKNHSCILNAHYVILFVFIRLRLNISITSNTILYRMRHFQLHGGPVFLRYGTSLGRFFVVKPTRWHVLTYPQSICLLFRDSFNVCRCSVQFIFVYCVPRPIAAYKPGAGTCSKLEPMISVGNEILLCSWNGFFQI